MLISEISEFSYLALGQIRKLGNLGNIFLRLRTNLNFIVKCDLQWWYLLLTVLDQRARLG